MNTHLARLFYQPRPDALTSWGRLCLRSIFSRYDIPFLSGLIVGKDEPSAGLSPVRQDETFIRTRRINKAGVSVIMVEQNARRCLQIADRGYVLRPSDTMPTPAPAVS
jgi:ABC-type cobalamin transport system ATPase subunit